MIAFDKIKSQGIFEQPEKNFFSNYFEFMRIQAHYYCAWIEQNGGGFLTENNICINEEEYSVQCFLGKSKNDAYDIRRCNRLYELENSDFCAIALLYGDDLLCLCRKDNHIYFYDTLQNAVQPIASDFENLLNLITTA